MPNINKLKQHLFSNAADENTRNIFSLFTLDASQTLLDLGCGDGAWTHTLKTVCNPGITIGLDIIESNLKKAKTALLPVKSDLNGAFPFKPESVDVIHANQVIEHLVNVDLFCEEMYRVLKPGGYVVVSTENLSSWHNLFALFLGRQAFSQHVSANVQIGNSMSLHHGENIAPGMAHIKIFTYYGLKDLFEYYKFKNIRIWGAGYHPLWGRLSRLMVRIDPRHSHFITLKAFK